MVCLLTCEKEGEGGGRDGGGNGGGAEGGGAGGGGGGGTVVAVAVEREVVVMAVEVTADLRPRHLLLDVLDTRHDAGAHRASSATRRPPPRCLGRRPVARAV